MNFTDLPSDIKTLIFSFNRVDRIIKENKIKFNSVLNDIKYINYYYKPWNRLDVYESCRYEFTSKHSDVLNYNDMINHLRAGGDMVTWEDFDLDEHVNSYDLNIEEHDEFMHILNGDYE
tara:strand:- start:2392 stop:2748 length:357 start_codon:yes stop_codon:yes gene_type:complete